MGWLIGLAIAGLVVYSGKTIIDAIQTDQALDIQQQQVDLQKDEALNRKKDTAVQYEKNYQDALDKLVGYDNSIINNEIDLAELGSKKSGYETLLERWQGDYDTQMSVKEADAYTTYKDLIANWTGTEVINASKGKSGTTALALENQSNKELRMYLGEDMKLNTREEMSAEGFDFDLNGGILGKLWREQHLNLLEERSDFQQQIDILTGSIATTEEALKTNLSGLSDAIGNAENLIGSIEDIRSEIREKDPNYQFGEIKRNTIDNLKEKYKDKI